MYKAILTDTGEEIIILHPSWRKRIDELRALTAADRLVCQGCGQAVRVKSGEVKRAHFAHKHLKACSYGSETPEILNARAVIYEWLYDHFGKYAQLEKRLDEPSLPRPVDCWVDTGAGSAAYWIIEAGIKLEQREAIKAAFERLEESQGVKTHFVFLHAMLNEEKKEFHSLLLTPTERAFLKETPYDRLFGTLADPGRSLHYLDADEGTLTTFRNLTLFHRPNWFKGRKKSASLGQITPGKQDGAFIYPGEAAQLDAYHKKQQRLERKRQSFAAREAELGFSRLASQGLSSPRLSVEPAPTHLPKHTPRPEPAAPEELPCITCGQLTTDYWSTFFDADDKKWCRCRACLDREMGVGS